MRQQTYSRGKERKDTGLKPLTGINQRLSADMIIVQRSATDAPKGGPAITGIEEPVAFGILDQHSGCGISNPRRTRSQHRNDNDLKAFVGPAVHKETHWIIVKSDSASEIIGAAKELGWFSEPSLANTWPHNTVHERRTGTLKSVCRAAMQEYSSAGTSSQVYVTAI